MSLCGARNVAALPLVIGLGISSSAIPCVTDLAMALLSCGPHRLRPSCVAAAAIGFVALR
jgi:hypothetical protein